jgi:hypothetical protein
MRHFNCKVLIRPNWLHVGKSMDKFHPPMCHVIWGCGIGIMIILQLYYNQCSIGTCHDIEEGHGILEFWLSFNYIITNGTLTPVTWHSWFTIKLNYLTFAMCMSQNLEFIDLLKMSAYDIVPCGHLCYTLAWHMASCCL